jgi:hypothetical protein
MSPSTPSEEVVDLDAVLARGSAELRAVVDKGQVCISDEAPPRRKRRETVEDEIVPKGPSTWGVKTFGGTMEGSGLEYEEAVSLWTKIYRSGTCVLLTKA